MSLVLLLLACATESPPPAPAAAPVAAPAAEDAHAHDATPHDHATPHGGVVKALGDTHVEALMMPAGVMFYLTDGAGKPLAVEGYAGTAAVKGPTGLVTVDLMPMGDHLHAAATLTQGQPASVVLTLTHAGAGNSAMFETQSVGLPSHDHTSLHGGQVGMWGDHHVEYAPADGVYRIWLTGENRGVITEGVSASVKDGEVVVPLTLEPATGMLSGAGAGAGSRPVTVDVKVGEITFSLGFNAVH